MQDRTYIHAIEKLDVLKYCMRVACRRIRKLYFEREVQTTEEKLSATLGMLRALDADASSNVTRFCKKYPHLSKFDKSLRNPRFQAPETQFSKMTRDHDAKIPKF